MSQSRFILGLGAALVGVLALTSNAHAVSESIIKLGFGGTEPGGDFSLSPNGVLQTINQVGGGQLTNVDFVGPLSDLTDILSGAVMVLSGVELTGTAVDIGPAVAQGTTGGVFSLYSPQNVLLLSGELESGTITGSLRASTGAFFADFATFLGGSLLPRLQPYPVGISIAFTDITSAGGAAGIPLICSDTGGCHLAAFTADGDGLISGAPVPEPFTGGLVLSGLIAGLAARRRRPA